MIYSIEMRKLRNAEFIQFVNAIADIIQSNDPVVLLITIQLLAFKAKVTNLSGLFKNEKSNPLTEDVQLLDVRRDSAVTGITSVVDGYTNYFQPEKAAAARLLSNSLKLYGPIARQNYVAETALITEMMNDWENNPELMAALTLLDLVDWKDELKTANNSFNEKWLERNREYAAVSPETLLQRREETIDAYNELKKFLVAYAIINSTTPVFQKTINELNSAIKQYNTILEERAAENGGNEGNTEEGEVNEGGEGEITPQPLP